MQASTKLRGHPRDSLETRLSKTLTWLLRHAATSQSLPIRSDGYIRVSELLAHPKLELLDLALLQEIVRKDAKNRYDLRREPAVSAEGVTPVATADESHWWIRANQGHSMKIIQVELRPIVSASDVVMVVHATTNQAWQFISKQGLSKMNRNHIHCAQGLPTDNVISGARASSEIFIHIDIDKAMSAGIKFFLSANGVVLTEGDGRGFLGPQFFSRVENAEGVALPGWKGTTVPGASVEATEVNF